MNSKLRFLTSEDYSLLWEKGKIVTYQKNEVILPENHPCEAIYLLRKGRVRVECSASGRGVAIACLSPGDIFRETFPFGSPVLNAHPPNVHVTCVDCDRALQVRSAPRSASPRARSPTVSLCSKLSAQTRFCRLSYFYSR